MKFSKLLDKLVNSKSKRQLLLANCSLIIGQKRAGKSTFSCMAAQYYSSLGYTCFSNYPVANCYPMPLVEKRDKKGDVFYVVDKEWLYTTNFEKCVLFFDEGANLWPARGFATDWTARDTEFFTMLSHHDTVVMINVQYLDLIDINVRRASDYIFFITRSRYFTNISNIAISELVSLPVANLSASIMSNANRRAYPVSYQVCELPIADYRFYRTPYYNLFDTHFDFRQYKELKLNDVDLWQNHYNFDFVL